MSNSQLDAFRTINEIFKVEVKPRKFYNLRLDPTDPENTQKNIYDILINVFLNGIVTLFGNTVNPQNIQKDQFDKLNSYMHSLGYNTVMNGVYDSNGNPSNIEISFTPLI